MMWVSKAQPLASIVGITSVEWLFEATASSQSSARTSGRSLLERLLECNKNELNRNVKLASRNWANTPRWTFRAAWPERDTPGPRREHLDRWHAWETRHGKPFRLLSKSDPLALNGENICNTSATSDVMSSDIRLCWEIRATLPKRRHHFFVRICVGCPISSESVRNSETNMSKAHLSCHNRQRFWQQITQPFFVHRAAWQRMFCMATKGLRQTQELWRSEICCFHWIVL